MALAHAVPLMETVAAKISTYPEIVAGHILHHAQTMIQPLEWITDTTHRIHLAGPVGIGKTSAIAVLSGLVLNAEETKEASKGKKRKTDRSILATSAGRTTLCAVEISHGDAWTIAVEPADPEILADFVMDYTSELLSGDGADGLVPEEVARTIRNMAGLTRKDAEALAAEFPDEKTLAAAIFERLDLDRRTLLALSPDDKHSPAVWMQKTFAELNSGRLPDVPFPARIKVTSPRFEMSVPGCDIILVDTKGGDGIGTRTEVHEALHDDRSIVVAASAFASLPDASAQALLLHARDVTATLAYQRLAVLGLAKGGEAEDVLLDTGERAADADQGVDVKIRQAQRVLAPLLRQADVPVLAFDAHESSEGEVDVVRQVLLDMVENLRANRLATFSRQADDLDMLVGGDGLATIEALAPLGDLVMQISERHGALTCLPSLAGVDPLVEYASMHASVVWASTRRNGAYESLNVHRLMADRMAAAVVIHATAFQRDMLDAIREDEHATPLVAAVTRRLRSAATAAPATAAAAAHDEVVRILSCTVAKDQELWSACSGGWGNPDRREGLGFRAYVADRFASQVDDDDDLEAVLRYGLSVAWGTVVGEIIGSFVQAHEDASANNAVQPQRIRPTDEEEMDFDFRDYDSSGDLDTKAVHSRRLRTADKEWTECDVHSDLYDDDPLDDPHPLAEDDPHYAFDRLMKGLERDDDAVEVDGKSDDAVLKMLADLDLVLDEASDEEDYLALASRGRAPEATVDPDALIWQARNVVEIVSAVEGDGWKNPSELRRHDDALFTMQPDDYAPNAERPSAIDLDGETIPLRWQPSLPDQGWVSKTYQVDDRHWLATGTFRQVNGRDFDILEAKYFDPVTSHIWVEKRNAFTVSLKDALEAIDPKVLGTLYVRHAASLADAVPKPPMKTPPALDIDTTYIFHPVTIDFFDIKVLLNLHHTNYKMRGTRVRLWVGDKKFVFKVAGDVQFQDGDMHVDVAIAPMSSSIARREEKLKVAAAAKEHLLEIIRGRREDLFAYRERAMAAQEARKVASSYHSCRIQLLTMWESWEAAESIRGHLRRIGYVPVSLAEELL